MPSQKGGGGFSTGTFTIDGIFVDNISKGLKQAIRSVRSFVTQFEKEASKLSFGGNAKLLSDSPLGGIFGVTGTSPQVGSSNKAAQQARALYGEIDSGLQKIGRTYSRVANSAKSTDLNIPGLTPSKTVANNIASTYGAIDNGLQKTAKGIRRVGQALRSSGAGALFGATGVNGPPPGGFTPTAGGFGDSFFRNFDTSLSRVTSRFNGFNTSLQALNKSLFPLINRYTLLFTVGYGLPNLIDRILDSTQSQVDAEAKLLAALGGRVQAFEKIAKLSKELQTTTRFADEELLEAAALLKNMGVAADDLDKALEAAVQTSAAIGVELTAAANSIGLFQQNATGATFGLTRRIPELKKLAAEGRLASEGVKLLLERFDGLAQKIAETPFGRAEIAYNRLRDVLTTIGAELTKIRAKFLEEFAERLQFIEDFANGEGFKKFIKGFEAFVPVLSEILFKLGGIISILVTISLGKWLYPVLAAATPIFIKITLVIAALRGVWELLGLISTGVASLGEAVGVSGQIVSNLQGAVSRGAGFWAELYDEDIIGDYFNYLLNQLKRSLAVAKIEIVTWWASVAKELDLPELFLPDLSSLQEEARARLNTIPSLIAVEEARIKTLKSQLKSFSPTFKEEDEGIRDSIAQAEKNIEKLRKELEALEDPAKIAQERIASIWEEGAKEFSALAERYGNFQGREGREIAGALAKITGDLDLMTIKAGAAKDNADALRGAIIALQSGSLSSDSISKIFKNVDSQAFAKLKKLFIDDLDELFERQNISAVDYVNARKALELQLLDIRTAAIDKEISDVEKAVKEQYALSEKLTERVEKEKDKETAIDLSKELLEIEGEIADLEEKRQSLYTQRVSLLTEEKEAYQSIEQAVGKISQKIEAAASSRFSLLTKELQNINNLVNQGELSQADGTERSAEAIKRYRVEVQEYIKQLQVLKLENYEYSELIDDIVEKINALTDSINPEKVQGFFANIGAGFKQTAVQLGDLDRLGAELGSTLANALGDGLAISLTKGKKAFKEWLRSFLEGLSQAIIRALVLHAITKAFGFDKSAATTDYRIFDSPSLAIPGNNKGGFAGAYAGGGILPGRGPNRDSIFAFLTKGEAITQRPAVDYYGKGFFEAVNRMQFPKDLARKFSAGSVQTSIKSAFNTGGFATGSGSGPIEAFIVGNDSTVSTLLTQGKGGFRQFLRKNKGTFRSDLGL